MSLLLVVPIAAKTQNNSNPWPTTGNVGIGTTAPNSQLHLHGTQNYIGTDKFGQSINFGVTSRQRFTTTSTGTGVNSGFELRYSVSSMNMINLTSGGNIEISAVNTPSIVFNSSAQRLFLGNSLQNPTWTHRASINIDHSSANGLFIRAANVNSYGVLINSINSQQAFRISTGSIGSSTITDRFRVMGSGSLYINLLDDSENAIICYGSDQTSENFKVKGNGEVFARRVRVTLDQFPDYVFASEYRLMPLSELRLYINQNSRLPNMPSAQEVGEDGVDLGEINRLLVEKVEELTLYILQLEQDLAQLQSQNQHESEKFKELELRLAQIELLLSNLKK